ncbi:hypothetical protein D3C85_768860 [compost metagenome]
MAPFVRGALGIERRQRLLCLGQLALGLAEAGLQRPQLGADELGPCGARAALELLVALGGFGLGFEVLEAGAQLATNVAEALQVLLGVADALLRLPAPLLVAGDPRRLLHEELEVRRARLHQPADGALLYDGVAARTQAGAEEEIGHVLATALLAVDLVVVGAVTQHLAAHRDLGITAKFTGHPVVGIVEHQLHRGAAMGAAVDGAVEDDVRHVLAAQVAGRALPQHPAHGVDDVGFATAVGAHHGGHVGRQFDAGRLDERLEAGEFDQFQTHGDPCQWRNEEAAGGRSAHEYHPTSGLTGRDIGNSSRLYQIRTRPCWSCAGSQPTNIIQHPA